eukprot:4917439-Amphidinium_carterae.3
MFVEYGMFSFSARTVVESFALSFDSHCQSRTKAGVGDPFQQSEDYDFMEESPARYRKPSDLDETCKED